MNSSHNSTLVDFRNIISHFTKENIQMQSKKQTEVIYRYREFYRIEQRILLNETRPWPPIYLCERLPLLALSLRISLTSV